jgi:hypothetical protein
MRARNIPVARYVDDETVRAVCLKAGRDVPGDIPGGEGCGEEDDAA